MSPHGARAVFLDRDGTLIEDVGYPRDPGQVRFLDGAPEGLARLSAAGFLLVLVSNQSGIGRGLIQPREAQAVHERLVSVLAGEGIRLAGAKYCPHAPNAGCDCRKPSPGMLIAAGAELGVDLEASFMIGDKQSDVEAGRRAGCTTLLLGAVGQSTGGADHAAVDWSDAVDFMLGAGR